VTARARYGMAFLAVVAVALGVAALWPVDGQGRAAAIVGVALCAGSGALSLALKGWARSLNAALLVVVGVFGLRAAVVALGALWATRWGGGVTPFLLGFFGTYLPVQCLEMGYLLAAAKARQSVRGR
jgi:hypothetical protein